MLQAFYDTRQCLHHPHSIQHLLVIPQLLLPSQSVSLRRCMMEFLVIVTEMLSVQLTRALLCVGSWSLLSLVKDEDVLSAARLADIDEDIDDLCVGWDAVVA